MKKVLCILLAIMANCEISYGQRITLGEASRLLSDIGWKGMGVDAITEDKAYEAPNSALTKRWFHKEDYGYAQFNPNGTLFYYYYWNRIGSEGFHVEVSGTWQRSKGDLTITLNYSSAKCILDDDLSGYSARQRDGIIENRTKTQAELRRKGVVKISYTIQKLDDFMVLDFKPGSPKKYEFCTYLASEDYIIKYKEQEAKKKEEERARREKERAEQEERARREEIQKKLTTTRELNSQAYSYLRQGQFDEAIATIDKAIELLPDNADIYDSKGEILYMKGDKEMAKAMWEKAFSLDPKIADPERGSALNWLVNKKGWHSVSEDFPYYVPFKKIRVLAQKWSNSQYCCAFFSIEPDSRRTHVKTDTDIFVQFFEQRVGDGSSSIKFKKCTDVGDGWIEYEFSKPVYFSHYQQNAPKDRLKILIE